MIWIYLGCTLASMIGGAYVWDRIMKYELARRGYGRWNPQNRQWQWRGASGYERCGFFG